MEKAALMVVVVMVVGLGEVMMQVKAMREPELYYPNMDRNVLDGLAYASHKTILKGA